MKNLLYIHGLKMSKDSIIVSNAISASKEGVEAQEFDKPTLDLSGLKKGASFTNIKELFAEYGYNSINASFDLFDVQGTLNKIKELIQKNKITLVVASSMGGFYALALQAATPVIVLNPSFNPSVDVLRLHSNVPENTLTEWKKIEANFATFKPIYKRAKFAIFSEHDELFHHKNNFDSVFGDKSSILVEGPHQLSHYRTYLDPAIEQIMLMMKASKVLG